MLDAALKGSSSTTRRPLSNTTGAGPVRINPGELDECGGWRLFERAPPGKHNNLLESTHLMGLAV